MSHLAERSRTGRQVRRGRAQQMAKDRTRGKRIGAVRLAPGEPARQIDLGATLAAALERQTESSAETGGLQLQRGDLHRQVRHQRPRHLVVFIMDTSDSMGDGPEERMSVTLGAAISLVTTAYLNRDQVCLITVRDQAAKLLVPPTDSVERLCRHLRRLPIGGATPLASGLRLARQVILQSRMRDPDQQPLVVLISDGEATVPLVSGSDPIKDACSEARHLHRGGIRALLIDTRTTGSKGGIMSTLAEIMGTNYHHLHALQTDQIMALIEQSGNTNR